MVRRARLRTRVPAFGARAECRDASSDAEGVGMQDPQLVERSLGRYLELLEAPAAGAKPEFEQARDALRAVVVAALAGDAPAVLANDDGELEGNLADVVARVAAVQHERVRLINPLTLGLGSPHPEWIFLGYESAYSIDEEPSFALEGCVLSTLWSADAGGIPFREHPYDLYGRIGRIAKRMRVPGHYWRKISELIEAEDGRWGDRAYLVEICAEPALAHGGAPPVAERVEFLQDLVRRAEARVLVVANRQEHSAPKEAIASAFLGVENLKPGETVTLPNGKRRVDAEFVGGPGRLVVFTRHLSNDVSHRFLAELRAQIHDRA